MSETDGKVEQKTDMQRFEEGVLVKGKLFGVEDVHKETGDEICQDAMIKLKAIIAVKKEHKQKLNIFVNLDGIEIKDEEMKTLYKHSVNRISYIARDLKDPRAIGYIYKNIDDKLQYFGLRTEKQAQEFFNLLKDLFETVLEIRKSKKENNETNVEKKPEETKSEEKPAEKPVDVSLLDTSDKAPLITTNEPEPITTSAPAPPSTPIPSSPAVNTSPVSQLIAPVTEAPKPPTTEASLFDLSEPTTPANPNKPSMDDLFGLGDLTLDAPTTTASPQIQSPQPTSPLIQGMNNVLLTNPSSPTPNNQNQFYNQVNLTNMNGMPNMSAQFSPMQQPMTSPFSPAFGVNNSMNQFQPMTQQAPPVPRAAPIPPPPQTTPKVQTNAFDDLFN